MRGFPVLLASLVATAWLVLDAHASHGEEPAGAPISSTELAARLEAGSAPLVLDVRTREEYDRAHIPGAVNIPHDEVPARLNELSIAKSEEVVVHCQSGRRAGMAEETLRASGYTNVRDLTGHWAGWEAAGLPSE